jgi:hypothetical protein
MPEQDDLQLIGRTFANVADTESARFARELGRVLMTLERDLLGLVSGVRDKNRSVLSRVGRLLTLRKEIRNALSEAGYSALVTRASLDAVERMAAVAASSTLVARSASLGRVSAARLTVLAKIMRADLLGLGDAMAQHVWRAAVASLYTTKPATEIVASLAKVIEKSRAQAQTLFDTQVSVVGRQIIASEPKSSDTQAYLYVGPVDGVVREWCLEQLGMVRTQPKIEALDNGQLPNPFITGGGFSCRHSWVAVSDPDLIALADTEQRAPGFAERVASARAAKIARKTKPQRRAA